MTFIETVLTICGLLKRLHSKSLTIYSPEWCYCGLFIPGREETMKRVERLLYLSVTKNMNSSHD